MTFLAKTILVVLMAPSVFAATVEKVTFPDTVSVGGKSLVLNGMGVRKVVRFGFPVKVYVGGLYLEKKNQDSKAILASAEQKRVVMQFVRPVDREALIESFQKGYMDNCQVECDSGLFSEFKKSIVSVRTDNQIILDFSKDGLAIESTGPNANKTTFNKPGIATNILAIFINEKSPPTPEFRQALLGK